MSSVYSLFELLPTLTGKGCSESRVRAMASAVGACTTADSVRFLVRFLCCNSRAGATAATLLDAVAEAHVRRGNPEEADAEGMIADAKKAIRYGYNLSASDISHCITVLHTSGVGALLSMVPSPGRCVAGMLGAPCRSAAQVVGVFHGGQGADFAAEPKYDGMRAQIHSWGGEVRIFSRHADDVTAKYDRGDGDLAGFVRGRSGGLPDFILDVEVVAWRGGSVGTFQELTSRKRKAEGDEDADICVFAFDALHVGGDSLVGQDYKARRERLRGLIDGGLGCPGKFQLIDSTIICMGAAEDGDEGGPAAAEAALEEQLRAAIASKCEGLMCKGVTSKYDSGTRGGALGGWRKLKKDYLEGAADTFDVVPVGAWRGSGRKAGWFSPWLVAVRDEGTGEWQTLCRVMSGFEDGWQKEKYEEYSPRILGSKPADIDSLENPPFWFDPVEVWEVRGADLTRSPVHTAGRYAGTGDDGRGIGLRFPRFVRTRPDKDIGEATTAAQVAAMCEDQLA